MTPPIISYGDPVSIANQLDENGVVCLENAVPVDWLARARADVETWLMTHGEHDHFILLPHGEAHAAAEDFINSPAVVSLLGDLLRARFPTGPAVAELIEANLRVIAGPRGDGEEYWFHYDASVVTMIVPIFMPAAQCRNSGELVGRFNKRPFRRFVVTNILEKAVTQSSLYRSYILRRLDRTGYLREVDMEVGNIYLFWGYRSLHGNMPCEPGVRRATLLLHFGRPHGSSEALITAVRLAKSLRGLGQKREEAVREETVDTS